jgi:hypothetical protein
MEIAKKIQNLVLSSPRRSDFLNLKKEKHLVGLNLLAQYFSHNKSASAALSTTETIS